MKLGTTGAEEAVCRIKPSWLGLVQPCSATYWLDFLLSLIESTSKMQRNFTSSFPLN